MTGGAYIDTSALAKYYLTESHSEAVESYLQSTSLAPAISRLTRVEFVCLLRRRRRTGQITAAFERSVRANFERQVARSLFRLVPLTDADFDLSIALIDRVGVALRSLDALHLAAATTCEAEEFVTADGVQAAAARKLGFSVAFFGQVA